MNRDDWPWIVGGFLVVGTGAIIAFVVQDEDVQRIATAVNVMLVGGLVLVTLHYAWSTNKIAEATREQADASARAVEEMREQRLIASRPTILQKPIYELEKSTRGWDSGQYYFDHYQVLNAGNGPVIELVVALLGSRKNLLASSRETFLSRENFLRTGETHEFPFHLADREEDNYYLVSEYQDVSGNYHQTWLPFKLRNASSFVERLIVGAEREIIVAPGELEFKFNVAESERLNTL